MDELKDNLEEIRAKKVAEEKAQVEQMEQRRPVLAAGQGQARETPDHIMQFFTFKHLPGPLAAISEPFCHLAQAVTDNLPRNPERTVALRKLLEAKDAAVRAFIVG